MLSIGHCQHLFCEQCLAQYCIYKITVHEDPICPQEGCGELLREEPRIDGKEEGLFYHLPQEMRERYKQNQIWKQSLQNPNIKLCPSEGCRGGEVDLLKIPPECRKCNTKYCKECMMVYHLGGCDQQLQKQFKQWKRCPKCKIFIQKTQGCNHMTCRCTHQFCFICLSNWQTSHYQCTQAFTGCCFTGSQHLPKPQSILLLILWLSLCPLLLLSIILILLLSIIVGFIAGICGATIALLGCIRDCKNFFGGLCCFIVLPIGILIGGVVGPFFGLGYFGALLSRRLVRKYVATVEFLVGRVRQQGHQEIIQNIQQRQIIQGQGLQE